MVVGGDFRDLYCYCGKIETGVESEGGKRGRGWGRSGREN